MVTKVLIGATSPTDSNEFQHNRGKSDLKATAAAASVASSISGDGKMTAQTFSKRPSPPPRGPTTSLLNQRMAPSR
eukprot:CAMPEP_0171349832 /NCGR_PEP_ID=MMETSP0878-20121228/34868_1 /TAXON_ID=67004 /ORGANISM="Thalassiosira weissflogii, Strain CCMP1336" /LENGTH=75 /DNA_ID=CAMNT_0011854597 /DNA_START=26 /DNA_END=250 /DNA_ORIENTATION=+